MWDVVIWMGALVSGIGLIGLIWCIVRVARAKRAGLSPDELRAAVQAVLPLNMGAMFLSVIGLMMVVVGIILS